MLTKFTQLCLALACFGVLATEASARPTPAAAHQNTFSDEEVLSAWEALDEPTQEEIVEWFQSEVIWLNTFQNSLIRFVLKTQSQDAGLWPILEDPPYYDPATHAPAQPIARHALAPTSSELAKKRKEFFFRVPERKLDSAWVYDYGSGELRRVARLDDPDRLFRNALRGFPPQLDLAEALIEQALDDGSERERAIAFGHAYTNRTGSVFTGLTLYDAWASGANMEMPDIDTLGILHDLQNDWKSYKAPVAGGKQKKLYDEVGKLFVPLHQHRGLRHALAMTFLSGYPALRDGYGANLDRFHAMWDTQESTPEKLFKTLPDNKGWKKFLESWIKKYDRTKKLQEAGTKRRDTLHNDGLWVRQKLVDIMVEAGFLKKE